VEPPPSGGAAPGGRARTARAREHRRPGHAEKRCGTSRANANPVPARTWAGTIPSITTPRFWPAPDLRRRATCRSSSRVTPPARYRRSRARKSAAPTIASIIHTPAGFAIVGAAQAPGVRAIPQGSRHAPVGMAPTRPPRSRALAVRARPPGAAPPLGGGSTPPPPRRRNRPRRSRIRSGLTKNAPGAHRSPA